MPVLILILVVAAVAGVFGTVLELALWGVVALVVGTAVVALLVGRNLLRSSRPS